MNQKDTAANTLADTQALAGTDLRYYDVRRKIDSLVPDGFKHMPYLCRVFAENILRHQADGALKDQHLLTLAHRHHDRDFPFHPARVVLQDLLGTPALVDLAGMRDAVAEAGGDPSRVNPKVPTVLVVDHSLNVEVDGRVTDALAHNMRAEQNKNQERFEFLSWCQQAFDNLTVLMPGSGILHQINIEKLSPLIQHQDGLAYPDSLVGTDSHTTMIDALGVAAWGVGGLEAESVMLGRAVWLRLPEIVKVNLHGKAAQGVHATDLVLSITEFMRTQNVVGAMLEFHGEGVACLSLADRATIANMAPEFGATAAMFAIDQRTLDYLLMTGRSVEQVSLVRHYAEAQGLTLTALAEAHYDRVLDFDLAQVVVCLAGPSDPHQRRPLHALKDLGIAKEGPLPETDGSLPDGAVMIAAITSCTNTSNPRSMIAAGLLAQKAVAMGLASKPWVKTSLAPGSQTVAHYLEAAGLMAPLQQLGFAIIGFACTSCNGMSGPLAKHLEAQVLAEKTHTTAVLSGNRNFDGRVHPLVKEAYLASPALVLAYALAGSIRVDMAHAPIAKSKSGKNIYLRDIWPSDEEIDAVVAVSVKAEQFKQVYDKIFAFTKNNQTKNVSVLFPWQDDSTYIKRPPYWAAQFSSIGGFEHMRALAVLGDNITTDHLSPSGAILPYSASGEFLLGKGVSAQDFNSYGTRRGNHVVAVRATFASHRLKNEMVGKEGSFARLMPDDQIMRLYEAAEIYLARKQSLIIIAGKNYGAGSSRDWAAKGVKLLGVQAVVCENFERIHRTNLLGMGVLPLTFMPGTTRKTLELDGSEIYRIDDMPGKLSCDAVLTLRVQKTNGQMLSVPVQCGISTDEELHIYLAGGLLPRIHKEYLHS
ncbi:MAG: hypothetical protein RLZZ502_1340 [Pseudomonadota bacterium]|jgi:aconitate hydratase